MQSGDGLLIRVKPFGGRLSADMLRTLAVVAAGCGNGAVELTGRGNIQLRGLSALTAPLAAAALVDAGLADPDPAREARRNVIAVPPCNDALVAAIEAVLADIPGLAPKFCVSVGAARADIQVREDRIVADGRHFSLSRLAGEGRGEGPRNIAETIRRIAKAADGQRLRILDDDPPPKPPPGLLLGLPFGQTDAAALLRLADLTGEETLRTTPWRAFLLPGAHDPAPFAAACFITDADDPRRSIAACAGAPACAAASVPARADAAYLAARGLRGIHVSGCAKGCAHPGAAVTLVGSGGSYGLVRHGRAGDPPTLTGLSIAQAAGLLG
jgi:precorrin-3B synthase